MKDLKTLVESSASAEEIVSTLSEKFLSKQDLAEAELSTNVFRSFIMLYFYVFCICLLSHSFYN